jgi:septum formation protein
MFADDSSATDSTGVKSPGTKASMGDNETLILASSSPRRREVLEQIGVRFRVLAPDIDESLLPGEPPDQYVRRLAYEKANTVNLLPDIFGRYAVLGADTIVVCDGEVLGKPFDKADALRMLSKLSGREHVTMSAVCVCKAGRSKTLLSTTVVRFSVLSIKQIEAYWNSGEAEGRAGSYAVQGLAAMFIEHLSGSYSGVVGLPLQETARLLAQFSVATTLDRSAALE